MAYLEDLRERRSAQQRRLGKREIQQAKCGDLTDPSILTEIEDITKKVSGLDAQIIAHSDLLTSLDQCAKGFEHVLQMLGNSPHCSKALEYQQRMLANIDRVRNAGDSPSDTDERKRLIEQIDALTKQTLNKTFNHFMRRSARSTTGQTPSPPPSSAAPARSDSVGTASITSIQNQNNVMGDHNIINNASYQNIYHGPVRSASDDSE